MKTIEQVYKNLFNRILSFNKELLNTSIDAAYSSRLYHSLSTNHLEDTDVYLIMINEFDELDKLLLKRKSLIEEIEKLPKSYRKQLIRYML